MNTATNSTRQRPGATTKQTYLDMLDTLDTADQFLLALQLIAPIDDTSTVMVTLATAARREHDMLRAFLNEGAQP